MNQSSINLECYTASEKTISILKANIIAFLTMGPAAFICFIIYVIIWKNGIPLAPGDLESFLELLIFIVGIIILTIVHEGVHGFFWHLFCKDKWKSIKFGFIKESLTPYCHCTEPLTILQYRLGCIAPLFVAGILPYIIALLIGNNVLLFISLVMILGAGGDVAIFLLILKEKESTVILDHNKLCGCIVYHPIYKK